ncbi:MAG: hypothetical protein ACXWUG_25270 [Polyangiales bacterium]
MRICLLLTIALVACGGTSDDSNPVTSPPDGATGDTGVVLDTGSGPLAETGVVADTDPGDAGSSDSAVDSACTTCAKLTGKVLRKALTKPQNGGKGDVYVAVFDHDPVTDRASAKVVGQTIVHDADMTADTAAVPYTIDAIPARSDPYFVIAFLDDNHTAKAAAPGPDKGDLVSLDGLASPKVTLASATAVTLDLPLNTVLPF